MFEQLENRLASSLVDIDFKQETATYIQCTESFVISHYINKYIKYSARAFKEKDSKVWIIAKDYEILKNMAYDISQMKYRCAIITSPNDIRYILEEETDILLVAEDKLECEFPKIEKDAKNTFSLKKGEMLDTKALCNFLEKAGYFSTPCVQNEGEFCQRGEVIDIFLLNSQNPTRVYLDFDKIESIRDFDPSSQLVRNSDASFDKIEIQALNDVSALETCPLFEYIEKSPVVFADLKECENLTPSLVFAPIIEKPDYRSPALKLESFKGDVELFTMRVKMLIEQKIVVYIATDNQIEEERIKSLLLLHDKELESQFDKNLFTGQKSISKGFYIPGEFAVFTYTEVFIKKKNRFNNAFARLETQAIESFLMLKEGDLVVHADFGVGKFIKLERMEVMGNIRDYIKIEFAGEDFYYVPLEKANLVQKYIGAENVSLDSINSKSWSKRKQKALENAKLFAEKLIKLYAMRQQKSGYKYSEDGAWGIKFDSLFEYDETDDQLKAIEDVKRDMQSPIPMDRIICGDVGFGKTEIAFRAAFKAIMDGKQVCFLSPTTILTNQHYNNFLSRSSSFPLNIKQLSRMVGTKATRECLAGLENGDVDIVFATHKILRSDVKFKNLGLLVIDEEQRFGVSDKEKIKSLKVNVDTLTLTATPIPRTLYMSMLNLRSMSLLKTPPALRLSVKTIVDTFDFQKAKKAIESELARGGQVYYLHNNTEDIELVKSFIQESFKNAKVDAVSGQHDSQHIEESIYNFATGLTDILVCTTIIENGIDVPNANTLIVDDATIYGTSQLYQIKGRVGRGKNQAYAYLFIPKTKENITSAIQRINIVAQNSTLGSGFNIAMGDLMLRGSGNILGKEQAGYVEEVGLDMYMHLLEKSIKELELEKENKVLAEKKISLDESDEVLININYTAYIPDDYISQTQIKFDVYKKIANAKSKEELDCIIENVKNRFGKTPDVFKNLYTLSLLKINMKKSGISELTEKNKIIEARIEYMRMLNIDKALNLIQKSKGKVNLNPQKPNYLFFDIKNIPEGNKLEYLNEQIEKLA